MQSLFLPEYIKSNMFIHDLHHKLSDHDINFDLILSDINYTNSPILTITPENKPNSVNLINARIDAISTSKHPLIILNELTISFLIPLFKILKDKHINITIINLSTWIWSLWKKINPEFKDLDFIPSEFNIFEPIDLENLRNILKQNWLNYIRLTYRELPDTIFDVDELWIIDASMLENLDTISLKTYGFSGDNLTIFASGSLFSTALQTWELLQNKWKEISIFIFQKLNSERTSEMIKSIDKTKKLYILIDHEPTNNLKLQIKKWLQNHNLKDIIFTFLTPNYNKLTTIFDEYQDEQTSFSPNDLNNQIIN